MLRVKFPWRTAHPHPLHTLVGDLAFNHNPTSHNCVLNCSVQPPDSPTRCVSVTRSVCLGLLCVSMIPQPKPPHSPAWTCSL